MVYTSMLHIKNVNFEIGDRQLLKNINITVNRGHKFILLGNNGAGKTTLLKIIINEVEPDSGTISAPENFKIGYLPQEISTSENESILEIALKGKIEVRDILAQMKIIHKNLEGSSIEQQQVFLKKLEILEDKFLSIEGFLVETKAKKILSGLGFTPEKFGKKASEFSGGWRMRANLARLLLSEPDLLLLDEPTNHLDIPSMEWLEQYLSRFKGGVIIVSHDRYFIEKIGGNIVELEHGELIHYTGDYNNYEEERANRNQLLEKKFREQKKEIARQERFIERFRYKNTKASQVQSRVKMLEKMEIVTPSAIDTEFNFRIPSGSRSFKNVLKMDNASFGYNKSEDVIINSSLELFRGEKTALIGVNGAGKTTTAGLISGSLTGYRGEITLGENVITGFYSQQISETLDPQNSIYEEVIATASHILIPSIRNILGVFGFSDNDVLKKTGYLSGGEKARVALARILLSPANFLIMDEPTTHLDRRAKKALTRALKLYEGTLLLITHDRYLIDEVATHVIFLDRGELNKFEGNYSYFASYHLNRFLNRESEEKIDINLNKNKTGKKSREQKRAEAEARQAVSAEINSLKKNFKETEKRIETFEKEIKDLEQLLSDHNTYEDKSKIAELQKEFHFKSREIDKLYKKWEELNKRIEAIKKDLS